MPYFVDFIFFEYWIFLYSFNYFLSFVLKLLARSNLSFHVWFPRQYWWSNFPSLLKQNASKCSIQCPINCNVLQSVWGEAWWAPSPYFLSSLRVVLSVTLSIFPTLWHMWWSVLGWIPERAVSILLHTWEEHYVVFCSSLFPGASSYKLYFCFIGLSTLSPQFKETIGV